MIRATASLRWIGILAPAVLAAGMGNAQTAPGPDDVTVRNRRLPAAEAPKAATCETLARDPLYRQQLLASGGDPLAGPRAFLPTRAPRNPDYTAPPLAPPGSPLPELGKGRFGAGRNAYAEQPGIGYTDTSDEIAGLIGGDASAPIKNVYEQSVDLCRSLYGRGSAGANAAFVTPLSTGSDSRGGAALDRLNARFRNARAFIVQNDTTLPMAFALFDQRRFAEALPWFRKAATKLSYAEGGDEARLFVGKLYLQGLGDKSDSAEGIRWLRKAATMPYNPVTDTPLFDPARPDRNTAVGEAAVILANVYRTGFRVPRDMAEACKWYARAEQVGHLPAAKMLGDIYADGDGVPRDVRKAVGYYRRAAEYDLADAQVALADILAVGDDGVARDPKAALGWYAAAARQGSGAALYALARAYDRGDGVTADQQRALGLYKAAALKGMPAAKVAIGTYFHEGAQVPRDDATARQWFAAAARDADPDGMFNLGAMYANGSGGPRDMRQAWVWLKRAATKGQAAAPAAVARVEALMTASDRAAAAELLTRS